MNDTVTGGTVDRPINDPAPQGNTEPVGLQTEGQGAPQTVEGDNQGTPQGGSDDGQTMVEDRRSRNTKIPVDRNELLGLRSERRELRGQVAELRAMLDEMRTVPKGSSSPETRSPKAAKTFFEAPEEHLESLREEIRAMKDQFREELRSTRQQETQDSQLAQQRADAVKLIHSQPGWAEADDQELIDIIEENGLGSLPPMHGAKAALAIFNQEKGIRNTTNVRQRATSIVGGPPSGAGAAKIWSKVEVDKILDGWSARPQEYDKKLAKEFETAHAEGRIR